MADNPQKPGSAQTPHQARPRPLSPHLTIYRWQITMLASITHRATGMGLGLGALVLVWWLVAVSNGPEGYENFMSWWTTPLGLLILFGFTWSLAFHFLNGIRHLAWDLGYGFEKHTATQTGSLVYVLSVVIALGIFAFAWTGHGGYLT
jgi:succinate dehydrogenase / fumarate reductase, cytochrome b subunit